jgi:hypothetical protein
VRGLSRTVCLWTCPKGVQPHRASPRPARLTADPFTVRGAECGADEPSRRLADDSAVAVMV